MKRPLTNQQQIVYDFIRDKIVVRGYGPTVREIGEHMNIKSPNGVMCHLRALERKGMIIRTANKSRAIELTEPISRNLSPTIPVQGTVQQCVCRWSSGDEHSPVNLATMFPAEDPAAIHVQDDSLLGFHVCSGDTLVVDKQASPEHGHMVVARTAGLDDELMQQQVGFLLQDHDQWRLHMSRPAQATCGVRLQDVQAVVVGVLRRAPKRPR